MTTLSTHVLDSGTGMPAAGVELVLADASGAVLTTGVTDADGRHRFPPPLAAGEHELTFRVGAYFAAQGVATFYPRASIAFLVEPGREHLHVPLLLSPFAYSTYRGS